MKKFEPRGEHITDAPLDPPMALAARGGPRPRDLEAPVVQFGVKFLKKKYQEKWKNVHLTFKSVIASGALRRPQTLQNLSHWNRYFVIYPHTCTLNNWRKSTRKSGRMHIWELKCKNFQHPKAGPRPWPIFAHFVMSAKSRTKFLGPHLTKSWICSWMSTYSWRKKYWIQESPPTMTARGIACPDGEGVWTDRHESKRYLPVVHVRRR